MSEQITDEFTKLIEDGYVNVNVVESPFGEKIISISDDRGDDKFSFSRKQIDQVKEFINEYEDIILASHELNDKYTGIELAWEIGDTANEYLKNNNLSNKKFTLLTNLGYSETYTHQMRNLPKVFPDKEYNEEYFTKSTICELTNTVSPETARVVNDNANNYEITVDVHKVRAIRDIYNSPDGLENSVKKAMGRETFKSKSVDNLTDVLYDAHLLLDYKDTSKHDIRELIKQNM